MDGRTVSTIVVRALGLWMLAWTAPSLISALVYALQFMVSSDPLGPYDAWWVASNIGTGIVFLLGAWLFIDGKEVIDHFHFVVPGRCARCGYDARGVKDTTCPECGAPLPKRRHKRVPVTESESAQ